MKLSQILKDVKTLNTYEDVEISGLTDDSRKLVPGCLFVCIEGARFDGHTVAEWALENGAVSVLTQKDLGLDRQIVVEDTREAYSLAAGAFFGNPARQLKLVGITGTNGKTTTSFILREVLEKAGYKTGLIGTMRNYTCGEVIESNLTTPDPMDLHALFDKMVKSGCEYCVMEVSSQALDQKRVAGLNFEVAAFTNLSQDHLDYHGSQEEYKKAKSALFKQCSLAVINLDDEAADYYIGEAECPVLTYSAKSDMADFTAKNIQPFNDGIKYEFVGKGVIGRIHFHMPGLFSVYNSMAAAACATGLGVELRSVLEALAFASGVPGRMEVVETGKDYTVIIDFAHTPDGLENVLKAVGEIAKGRIITLFGCGGDRDRAKRPLMGEIATRLSDLVVVTSDNPRTEKPEAIIDDILAGIKTNKKSVRVEVDRKKAIGLALSLAKEGDIVLLAGKGHETTQTLADKTIEFDERKIVKEILANK